MLLVSDDGVDRRYCISMWSAVHHDRHRTVVRGSQAASYQSQITPSLDLSPKFAICWQCRNKHRSLYVFNLYIRIFCSVRSLSYSACPSVCRTASRITHDRHNGRRLNIKRGRCEKGLTL